MKTNYVLIDFENVQPKSLNVLTGTDYKVIIFVGANQSKISFELAATMQSLGDKAEYIKIEGNGPNALDFHIAFYMGRIAAQDKNVYFHIVSKDKGFDPLIKHIKGQKIHAGRVKTINEIPLINLSRVKTTPQKIDAIVKHLHSRGKAKPRKLKTLSNTINSLFSKKLDQNELDSLVEELIKKEVVIVNGSNINYDLPD